VTITRFTLKPCNVTPGIYNHKLAYRRGTHFYLYNISSKCLGENHPDNRTPIGVDGAIGINGDGNKGGGGVVGMNGDGSNGGGL
jgi:hypothetical protein